MTTVTLEQAQTQLPELIQQVATGEEIIIEQAGHPVARLVGAATERPKPVFGRAKGMLIINQEDDEHLKDFAEYMP